MMNRFYFTIILLVFTCIASVGQTKSLPSVLSGIVVDVNVRRPVPDITVFTQFGDVVTDMRGKFNLSLSQCNCRVGEQIIIYTMSEEYGYSENKYTITNAGRQNVTLKIFRNSNIIYQNGIVKDERTHDPIESINVKLLFNNTSSEITAVTDKDGIFRLPIPKKILGNESSVRIIYTDGKHRYKQLDELQAINSFAKVFLQRSANVNSDNNIVDHKKELNAKGVQWNHSSFIDVLKRQDLILAGHFIQGGMKLNADDFVSYFSNYYNEKLTDLFIKYNTVNAQMCPCESFEGLDVYTGILFGSIKGKQLRAICGTNENIETLNKLITTEQSKVNKYRKKAKNIITNVGCVGELTNCKAEGNSSFCCELFFESAVNTDSLINTIAHNLKSYFTMPVYGLIDRRDIKENMNFEELKATVKEVCPDLFIIMEADGTYLKKLLRAKDLLTNN